MSMKRTKQRSFGARDGEDENDDYFKKPSAPEPKWEDIADKPDDAFTPYALSSRFAKGALIAHSKFGKGIVVAVEATNMQVLFQDGTKKLGHGAS
jgi:hypothetical protein